MTGSTCEGVHEATHPLVLTEYSAIHTIMHACVHVWNGAAAV